MKRIMIAMCVLLTLSMFHVFPSGYAICAPGVYLLTVRSGGWPLIVWGVNFTYNNMTVGYNIIGYNYTQGRVSPPPVWMAAGEIKWIGFFNVSGYWNDFEMNYTDLTTSPITNLTVITFRVPPNWKNIGVQLYKWYVFRDFQGPRTLPRIWDPPEDAAVSIKKACATLSVDPSFVEARTAGVTFSVNLDISEFEPGWRAIGTQFTLLYDPMYLKVINVTEGPFFQNPQWNLHGAFFFSSVEVNPVYGPCVLIADQLFPDNNGNWTAFPTGNGTVATVGFEVIDVPRGLDKPPEHINLGFADPLTYILNDNLDHIETNLLGAELTLHPTHIADVNEDGKVSMIDLAFVAHAFGARLGFPGWNASYDIVVDDVIDMKDIATVAKHFGWTTS